MPREQAALILDRKDIVFNIICIVHRSGLLGAVLDSEIPLDKLNGIKAMSTNAPPCLEAGRPMNPCARALKLQTVEGRQDLAGEWWNGWKLRGPWLVGPGGMKFNARSLAAAWRGYLKAGLPVANDGPGLPEDAARMGSAAATPDPDQMRLL